MGTPLNDSIDQIGSNSPASRGRQFWWWLIVALTLAVMLPALWYPPCRDTAIFLLAGDIMNNGGVPYRDLWEIKPPAIILAYALPAWLGGDLATSWVLVRVLDTFLAAIAAYLVASLARRLAGVEAAVAAAGWYLVLYFCGGYESLAQTESWGNLGGITALLLLWRWREYLGRGPWHWFLIGMTTGILTAVKPTSILLVFFPLVVVLWQRRGKPNPEGTGSAWTSLPALVIGLLLPNLLILCWLWQTQALEDYLDITKNYVVQYTASGRGDLVQTTIFFLIKGSFLAAAAWLPGILALVGLLNKETWHPGAKGFTLATGLGGFLAVVVQFRGYTYHFQVVLPALAVLAGVGTVVLINGFWQGKHRWTYVLIPVLAWQFISQASTYYAAWQRAAGNWNAYQLIQHLAQPESRPALADAGTAVDYVRWHSDADDRFLIFGMENEQNILANRRSATKYIQNLGLIAGDKQAVWRSEFMDQLEATPPKFFEVIRDDDMVWIGATPPAGSKKTSSEAYFKTWPELSRFVEQNYRRVLTRPHLSLYELREIEGDTEK